MSIYEYITKTSYPISLDGTIEDIMNGLITVREHRSGCLVYMGDKPKDIERHLKKYLFAGEELTEDEHILFVEIRK